MALPPSLSPSLPFSLHLVVVAMVLLLVRRPLLLHLEERELSGVVQLRQALLRDQVPVGIKPEKQ